jgi:general secretion pathway protein F
MEFEYTARTNRGERVAGTLLAENEHAALRALEAKSLFPVAVVESRRAAQRGAQARMSARALGIFYGQLADLLGAGVPLLRSLSSLADAATSKPQRDIIVDLQRAVERGTPLAEAMIEHPRAFPLLHRAMVEAGERASFLESVLRNLSSFIERLDDLRSRVRGALIYPALLAVIGTTVLLGALVFFVPRFEPLLSRIEKPLPTRIVFGMSRIVREDWPIVVIVGVGAIAAMIQFSRSDRVRLAFESLRLRVPIVGSALRMVAIARFARILGTLLANGVPMLHALAITRNATGSNILARSIDVATESVRAGASLSGPIGSGGFVPPQILAMIRIAEESNQLENVLVNIADTVERRTQAAVDQAVRLIEPVVLCLVAAAIGFLALGLLLPIFTLAGSLGSR